MKASKNAEGPPSAIRLGFGSQLVTGKLLGLAIVSLLVSAVLLTPLVLYSATVEAGPAANVVNEFRQPDGTILKLHLWGDEFANGFETLDGSTVIKNLSTGFWEFAILDENGRLAPSGVIVGKGKPPAEPFLRPRPQVIKPK
jgi:hypothetical protein